jgi:heat shock protein HslJ
MKKLVIFLLTIILSLYGCKKENSKNADLLNTKWILSYIQDTKTNAITNYPSDEVKKISIVFTNSLNVIAFSGVCNGGAGTYSYSSSTGAIKITELITTAIGCKYDEWEEYTTDNLNNASSYKINGNNLIINSNGAYNLYFTEN